MMNDDSFKVNYGYSESFIKNYRYFSSTLKNKERDVIERQLIVTTKRLIFEETSRKSFSRDEYPVDNIDRVETSFFKSKKIKLAVSLIIIGLILGVVSFILKNPKYAIEGFNSNLLLIPFILGIIGFIFGLIILIFKKTKLAFSLTIYSKNNFYKQTTISGENFKDKARKAKPSKEIKIIAKVTPAALVMLNEINALLIDIKDMYNKKQILTNLYLEGKISDYEYDKKHQDNLNHLLDVYKN